MERLRGVWGLLGIAVLVPVFYGCAYKQVKKQSAMSPVKASKAPAKADEFFELVEESMARDQDLRRRATEWAKKYPKSKKGLVRRIVVPADQSPGVIRVDAYMSQDGKLNPYHLLGAELTAQTLGSSLWEACKDLHDPNADLRFGGIQVGVYYGTSCLGLGITRPDHFDSTKLEHEFNASRFPGS